MQEVIYEPKKSLRINTPNDKSKNNTATTNKNVHKKEPQKTTKTATTTTPTLITSWAT